MLHRKTQQRLKDLVHQETQRSLEIQEELNKKLLRAIATLRVSEEKLAVTLNSIGDGVIATDDKGRLVLLNRVAAQLTGWTPEEAIGRAIEDVFKIINQETREAAAIPIIETLAHGTIQGLANHTVLISRDGDEYAISDSCAPILESDGQVSGAVLVFRNVTEEYATREELHHHQIELEMQNEELRRAQAELDRLRARYFDLYDLAPVGYCTVSEDGLIIEANLFISDLLGVSRSALVKTPIGRFFFRADSDSYYLLRQRIRDTKDPQALDLRMLKPDSSTFWAHLSVSAAQDDGVSVLRIVVSDISESKRLEAERAKAHETLEEKNLELQAAKSAAEKANHAKSDFLSSMSHELRTPLGAILGFAQLMESDTPLPSPAQQRSIDQILKAGWYLLELINEVLDLSLIESGKLSLWVEPVLLTDVLHECEAMVEPQAQKRGIDVVFAKPPMPYFVHADRTRLKQVLINLLSNGIKYNKAGGKVSVTYTQRSSTSIRICVQDTGEGLAPEQLTQLFQPFNRLGQKDKIEEGTGIGLVVAKRLVELMQGVIGVESTVGKGSIFWFELNLTAAPLVEAPDAVPVLEVQPQAKEPLYTLLCVEDNLANLMLVESILARRPDIHLISARDGNRGIEIARATLPDVILMDINLPGISGLMALKILASEAATACIPVIALSANAIPRDVEQGLAAGFFRYLTKPIKIKEFMDTVDVALKFAKTEADRRRLE